MSAFKCNTENLTEKHQKKKKVALVLFFCLFLDIKMPLTNIGLETTDEAGLKDNSVNEACTWQILERNL